MHVETKLRSSLYNEAHTLGKSWHRQRHVAYMISKAHSHETMSHSPLHVPRPRCLDRQRVIPLCGPYSWKEQFTRSPFTPINKISPH
ncbi:hypothetical protein BDV95DRAFT_166145 [Massariosphaeria phaeospora]|uniref:Uncharacterized protein n=1 Tax=Massariosphaeria phaeospora TaxID=100035 RepID=A0A7C8M5F2_9PLEO|nr:hypothetical protein BDV95DRAFT_166145 [Massariosphaeria phaeospora]